MRNFVISFVVFTLFVSCIVPESTHKKSTFHLLSRTSFDQNHSTDQLLINNISVTSSTFTFYLRQVELPYYLQENRIVKRPTVGKIEFREHDRWGEPIADGVGRVLGLNLFQLLGNPSYSTFPHRQKANTRYEISVTIHRFEKISIKKVLLDVTWELFNKGFENGNSPILSTRDEIIINIKNGANETTDEVLALSELLGDFSKGMANEIKKVHMKDF